MKHLLTLALGLTLYTATAQELALAVPVNSTCSPYQQGLAALRGQRFQEAFDLLTVEVNARPDHGKAWYHRGEAQQGLGNTVGALHDMDRALALRPHDPHARLRRADLLVAEGRMAEARTELDRVIATYPDGPVTVHALFSLGNACMAQDDIPGALAAYDRLVQLAPADAHAWYDRGIARSHAGDAPGAVADLTEALKLSPAMAEAYAARAIAEVHADRKAEACSDARRARELGEAHVDDLVLLYCR